MVKYANGIRGIGVRFPVGPKTLAYWNTKNRKKPPCEEARGIEDDYLSIALICSS